MHITQQFYTLIRQTFFAITFIKSILPNIIAAKHSRYTVHHEKPPRTSSDVCLDLLGWLTLYQYRCLNLLWQIHKCILHNAPEFLYSILRQMMKLVTLIYIRGRDNLHLSHPRTEFGRNSLLFRVHHVTTVYHL